MLLSRYGGPRETERLYLAAMQQPSGNLDDSGYFSVQVIASALKVWGLDIVPYSSSDPVAQAAQADPT